MNQTLDTRPQPTGEVDPRIQARRDLVAHERQARRRRRLLVLAAVAGVLAVAWAMTHSPLLAVHKVIAVGTPHVPARAVIAAAGIHDGQHLVDVDEGAARAKLLALPWVADAKVDVSWSGTARLRVTERTVVAAVVAGRSRWVLVDARGRAVARVAAVRPTMPVVSGLAAVAPGASFGPALTAPLQVIAELHPGLRSRVTGIVVARDGSILLRLRSGGVAQLCQPVDVAAKLASLTTVFAHVDDQGLQVVNVCIADSPTIRRGST